MRMAIRYGLSVFFSNDSTMGDDLLISGNPDWKVISTLATDFYRAPNADLPDVDLTIRFIECRQVKIRQMYCRICMVWIINKPSLNGKNCP